MVSAVIAAYNEERNIKEVINRTKQFVTEVVVVDDASYDNTFEVAKNSGARVIVNNKNIGQLESLKKGFKIALYDVIINLDADGEHVPEEIPKLTEPILNNEADLVLGKRETIPRISERFIDWLVKLKSGRFYDSGTGFRAIRKDLALRLNLRGNCVCGVLVLEALRAGARIKQVPITINQIKEPRGICWNHTKQIFIVLEAMVKKSKVGYKKGVKSKEL